MSFIRPEAGQFLRTYSEVFLGLMILGVGVINFLATGWVLPVLGVVCMLTGGAIAFTAFRRARFPAAKDGPGVVEVDERQISYFSAYAGGAVSIEALARVRIETSDVGPWGEDMIWVFEEDGGNTLQIPASASNIEGLFDAFAALDGVNYEAVTEASKSTETGEFLIWSKQRAQLH